MKHCRTELQKGKALLARHDAAGAVKVFSRALSQCPSEDCGCLTKSLFYLGVAMKKLGLLNSAIKLWVSAYKIKKNRLVKKMLERYANGYGMVKQANLALDDQMAFFSIQIMRYVEKKACHGFSTHAEKDVVYELIKDHWTNLVKSSTLTGKAFKEKTQALDQFIDKIEVYLDELAVAPDFQLKDTQGNLVSLSAYRGKQPVVLVLTRGFM